MRFGLYDPIDNPEKKEYTLKEIGEILGGLSRERIRQIEGRAMRKIRKSKFRIKFLK